MIVGSLLHYFYFLLFLLDELLEELLKKFQSMKGKSILILGPNCAGKTTLLKYCVLRFKCYIIINYTTITTISL